MIGTLMNESHEVIRALVQKVGAKEVADALGLSLPLIYKWSQPADESGSGSVNPLDRVASLVACAEDDGPIKWLCRKAGGYFVEDKAPDHACQQSTVPATHEIVQEFADMLAVIARAGADDKICDREAREIREQWEELKSVTECFVRCCEAGNFAGLRSGEAKRG